MNKYRKNNSSGSQNPPPKANRTISLRHKHRRVNLEGVYRCIGAGNFTVWIQLPVRTSLPTTALHKIKENLHKSTLLGKVFS